MCFLRRNKIIYPFLLFILPLICGCSSLIARLIINPDHLRVPEVIAHLEPVLRENQIVVLGKIVINNPTESVFGLQDAFLIIRDNQGDVLSESVLEWKKTDIASNDNLSAPVEIKFNLAVLNREYIDVIVKTGFYYKKLALRVPIENKVAVLYLNSLKESIQRQLDVRIHTKFHPGLLGEVSVGYAVTIVNPVNIDLLLEDGVIQISAGKEEEIVRSLLTPVLFKSGRPAQVEGVIKFKKKFDRKVAIEFIKGNPVKVKVTGKLRLSETEIFMPFKIESIQELDFSLFQR